MAEADVESLVLLEMKAADGQAVCSAVANEVKQRFSRAVGEGDVHELFESAVAAALCRRSLNGLTDDPVARLGSAVLNRSTSCKTNGFTSHS